VGKMRGLVLVRPGDRAGNEDKHKAPSLPLCRSLSLRTGLRCCRSLSWAAELLSIQAGVETSACEQRRVSTALDNASSIDHQNLIGGQNGRETVGDGQGG